VDSDGHVTIPSQVTTLGYSNFGYCEELTSISFEEPSQLKIIGREAFLSTGLTSVSLPGSVESIGVQAFRSCNDLTAISFEEPSQLKTIESRAF
jgi:hypothetical protein